MMKLQNIIDIRRGEEGPRRRFSGACCPFSGRRQNQDYLGIGFMDR